MDGPVRDDSSGRSLVSRLGVVSGCTLVSRVLGLVRDVAMAALFGGGAVMDAFSVAFRLPNLARRLFGEGALTAAFLPAFVRSHEQDGRRAAERFAAGVIASQAVLLVALVLGGELLLALGWWLAETDSTRLLVRLTAILLPYLAFICVSAQLSAVLHGMNCFHWPALVPILLNVTWIAGAALAMPIGSPAAQVTFIAGSIVAAGVLQAAVPWWALRRRGFTWHLDWTATKGQVADVWRAVWPVAVGAGVIQLNPVIDSTLAWALSAPESAAGAAGAATAATGGWSVPAGTASALYYGQRLFQFPLGVFGVALGTVLFPTLARCAGRGDTAGLREHLEGGLNLVVWVTVPASVGLAVLAVPLTDLIFRHGAFDTADVRQTAAMISAYGAGVWAACALLLLNRAFYAAGDRGTPVRLGIASVLLNLVLDLALLVPLGGAGLAWATTITSAAQCIVSLALIGSRTGRLDTTGLLRESARAILAAAVMATAILAVLPLLPDGSAIALRLARVITPVAIGGLVYLALSRLLRCEGLKLLRGRPPVLPTPSAD
jgi:putative peptidoglycan lipid II flippase